MVKKHTKKTHVEVDLPANKGYAVRRAWWNRVTKDGYPCVGILEIREYKKHLYGTGRDRRYAVLELDRDPLMAGRRFQVSKPLAILVQNDDRYYCLLDDNFKEKDLCTCKGFESGVQCAHILALRALLGAGGLPPVTMPHALHRPSMNPAIGPPTGTAPLQGAAPLPPAKPPHTPQRGKGKPPAPRKPPTKGKRKPHTGP